MRKWLFVILCLCSFLWMSSRAAADLVLQDELGCVYDTDLNISWMQNANPSRERMTWSDGLRWISELNHTGLSGWRLPSIEELEHINKVEGISPSNPGPFENLEPYHYWSNTGYASQPRYAWGYSFFWMYPDWGWIGYHHYIWPVRDGSCQ